jgi:hypothetical protein
LCNRATVKRSGLFETCSKLAADVRRFDADPRCAL